MPETAEFSPTEITLAVLAGGAGSRMGRPKAELCVGGLPILQFLLKKWQWPGPTLLITAPGRQRPPGAALFDREVPDPVTGQGPLRGLLTALESAVTELVVFATVDMPGVGSPQLEWVASRCGPSGTMICRERGIEPFPSVFRRSWIEMVRRRLEGGRRSVHGLAAEPGLVVVRAPDDWESSVWSNLNSPADLDSFESQARGQ
jgi:molybdopterin-guanine dinucleotide biosynthesis protein A